MIFTPTSKSKKMLSYSRLKPNESSSRSIFRDFWKWSECSRIGRKIFIRPITEATETDKYDYCSTENPVHAFYYIVIRQ